ncbi:protein Wiz-like, partial [Discoglossus pictus]
MQLVMYVGHNTEIQRFLGSHLSQWHAVRAANNELDKFSGAYKVVNFLTVHFFSYSQDQDHLIPTLSSPKFTPPKTDIRTVQRTNPLTPPNVTSAWSFQSSETQEEDSQVTGVPLEGNYLQDKRFEWSKSVDEDEGHLRLMTVRSIPPSINMPVFRRALQFSREQMAWQGVSYSEEEAQVEVEQEEEDEGSVYTCIECSIYFKKKAHLLEHMFQHSREGEGEGTQTRDGPYTCGECGKSFVDEENLVSHRRLHQESRQKIIEEIRKLENLADEGRDARLQCPKCLFGTNSSKTFVQHAKTHVRKSAVDGRGATTSFQETLEMVESGGVSEQNNDRIWRIQETENGSEQGWRGEVLQEIGTVAEHKLGKMKTKNSPREAMESSLQGVFPKETGSRKARRAFCIPRAAVELKWRFREALKAGGDDEERQRKQLREEVAIVVLENIAPKKRRPKGLQAWSYGRRLCRGEVGEELSMPSCSSSLELELPQDEWGESGIPLDILLMDPNYEGQLEALGLRSEERECPYCPDRFHNGIGLANHVRGHLNRVGVSYNVRHFISAEEVKAIEQNYSFQKKRKKVANFDPSTFSLMRCEFCGAGFDTRAGLSSHARAHLRDFGITNWELTVSPIHVLARLLARSPGCPLPPFPHWHQDADTD